MTNTKTIAKNSLFLYFRMFVNMVVGLFTAGVVLKTLGITDYGIYNIVAGFVSMFSFLNSSMSSATQRFLSIDLGKKDSVKLQKTFSTAINIHLATAIIIILFLETFGLWYINNKLNVPVERLFAVNVVFQFSVFSTFFYTVQVPYSALITAHERFNVYAMISIVEIFIKLIILFLIIKINYDKLILYALLLFIAAIMVLLIERIYCRKHFAESKYEYSFDKSYVKEMLSFTGWSIFGSLSGIARGQGNNLLLNWFFGPTMNAAYGITNTIQGAVNQFVSNFQLAVNPQIVKNYSSGQTDRSIQLIKQSAKLSFGMMFIIVLPVIASTSFILDIWLKNYPAYTVLFIKLSLINVLIDTVSNPIMMGLQATGKIKIYQIVVSTLTFLNLPISYILIHFTGRPEFVFITSICISLLAIWFRLYFVRKHLKIGIRDFVNDVIVKIVLLTSIMFIVYLLTKNINLENIWLMFFLKSIILVITSTIFVFFIMFSKDERLALTDLIKRKVFR